MKFGTSRAWLLAGVVGVANGQRIRDTFDNDPAFSIMGALDLQLSGGRFSRTCRTITYLASRDEGFASHNQQLIIDMQTDTAPFEWGGHTTELMLPHILSDSVSEFDFIDGEVYKNIVQSPILVSVSSDFVVSFPEFNASIIEGDVPVERSAFHILDKPLWPSNFDLTIVEKMAESGSADTIIALANQTGLLSKLSNDRMLTFMAPTDAAIQDALANITGLADKIQSPDFLKSLIEYHILDANYSPISLDNALFGKPPQPFPTIQGFELALFRNSFLNFTVNGVAIHELSAVGNGVVGFIEQLLIPPTVATIVMEEPNLSILANLTQMVGLVDVLDTSPNVTLFAPDNMAFDSVPGDFLAKIQTLAYITHLRDLLLYHVVDGAAIESSMVMSGDVQAANMETFAVSVSNTSSITINGNATVTTADKKAFNPGFVHIIDGVLTPSWVGMTLPQVAGAHADLGTFANLVNSLGAVANTLSTSVGHTVFAVTNSVFSQLEMDNKQGYDAFFGRSDVQDLVVQAHVVEGVLTKEQIMEGSQMVQSISGEMLNITRMGEMITVNGIMVTMPDVLADNGVMHFIDGVIFPGNLTLDALVTESPSMTLSLVPSAVPTPLASAAPTLAPTTAPTSAAAGSIVGISTVAATLVGGLAMLW